MRVSFDGMRRNATSSMNRLHTVIDDILATTDEYDISATKREELTESFNDAAMFVDSFNCLYDDNVEDDMTNLSDLEIKRLEIENKEEEEDD